MSFEDYKTKPSVVIVYSGEGKGKTSAALGLMSRSLGNRGKVAFIQFIKHWGVSEHVFIRDIQPLFKDQLYFYKGGKGFYNAGDLSPKEISKEQHIKAAEDTYKDGLITIKQLQTLIEKRSKKTSLCLTGRDFPSKLVGLTDIYTNMEKIKHHFDNKYLANKGIDF